MQFRDISDEYFEEFFDDGPVVFVFFEYVALDEFINGVDFEHHESEEGLGWVAVYFGAVYDAFGFGKSGFELSLG